jgi:hypothetical protein
MHPVDDREWVWWSLSGKQKDRTHLCQFSIPFVQFGSDLKPLHHNAAKYLEASIPPILFGNKPLHHNSTKYLKASWARCLDLPKPLGNGSGTDKDK